MNNHIETVSYELEWLNPATEEYDYIELSCEVMVCPAEPDVGIMHQYAEIQNTADKDGKCWGDELNASATEWIQEKAIEQVNDQ